MANWPKLDPSMSKDLGMCFGCGKHNPVGLKLAFSWDGDKASAEFTPRDEHQSWSGIVHGGIILVLLDEALSYAAHFNDLHCVTAELDSRLRRPAAIGETLFITSSVRSMNRRLVKTEARITLKDGTLVAEAEATHFVVKQEDFNEFSSHQSKSNAA